MEQKLVNDRFMRFSVAMDTILKKIQKYKNERLSSYGLRSMHLMFMYCLFKDPNGLTPGELAKKCSVDKAFISRITNDLKKMGYVDYSPEEKTVHYKRKLFLTPSGNSIMSSVNEIITESVDRITSGISPEELEVFYSVISKFDNNLISLSE